MKKRKNTGLSQKNRGRRAEYKVRDLFIKMGWQADRVPISGSGSIKGDVIAKKGKMQVVAEVKRMSRLPKVLLNTITSWKNGGGDVVRTNDGDFIIVNASFWLKDPEMVRDIAKFLLRKNAFTITVNRLPKSIMRKLEQAEREGAVLFIVPGYKRELIVIERLS